MQTNENIYKKRLLPFIFFPGTKEKMSKHRHKEVDRQGRNDNLLKEIRREIIIMQEKKQFRVML